MSNRQSVQGDKKLLASHEKLQSLQNELAAALDAERMRSTEASTHMEAARRLRDERDTMSLQFEQCKAGLIKAVANTDKLRAGVCPHQCKIWRLCCLKYEFLIDEQQSLSRRNGCVPN
jgi:hypothetical protein